MGRLSAKHVARIAGGDPPAELGLVSPEYLQNRQNLPLMPVGFYDESPASPIDLPSSGAHYAWISTPRWTGKPDAALRETSGPIRIADLGSAFPIFAELLRSLSFERAGRRASDIVTESARVAKYSASTLRSIGGVSIGNYAHQRIFSTKGIFRPRLVSAIQTAVYCTPETDLRRAETSNDGLRGLLVDEVLFELLASTQSYDFAGNSSSYEGKRRINVELVTHDNPLPFDLAQLTVRTKAALQIARSLRGSTDIPDEDILVALREQRELGVVQAIRILDDIADRFGTAMMSRGLTRSYNVTSVDVTDSEVIAEDASTSFDRETSSTGIYKRACENLLSGRNHIQKDILEYLVGLDDESMTYLVSVECFPYFFGSDSSDNIEQQQKKMQVIRSILFQIVRVLQPGGRFVAIPMNIAGNNDLDSATFTRIRQELLDTGVVEIEVREYSERQLRAYIEQADSGADGLSPMMNDALSGGNLFRVIEIKKPARNKSARPTIPSVKSLATPNPMQ